MTKTRRPLKRENVSSFLVEEIGPAIDDLQVSGIQFIADELTDEGPDGGFDEVRAVLLELPGALINGGEHFFR
jgi:hypothetical protein